MARKDATTGRQDETPDSSDQIVGAPDGRLRVLIVSASRHARERFGQVLLAQSTLTESVPGVARARRRMAAARFDVLLLDASASGANRLMLEMGEAGVGPAVVLVQSAPSVDDAVSAMRAGVADLIAHNADPEEMRMRIRTAGMRARREMQRADRVRRLRKLCVHLNSAREEVTEQVGDLCNDLVNAYQELSDQMSRVTIASEFNNLIRRELDLEDLLRTVLEYLLGKIGPTNAAIFLPSTSGDFTLGAYVNYDCPSDTAEVLLDHLACVLAPRFEEAKGVQVMSTDEQLEAQLGEESMWLHDQTLVTFSCRHDDECLGVVALFRDRHAPYEASAVEILDVMKDLFARQLARVIHVHHRHLPKDQWGVFGEGDDNAGDIDLAA